MKLSNLLHVVTRDEWREWLAKHYAAETEIWLVFYKKQSGKPRLAYEDAVEEALCFGWIDSLLQRIDDEKYAQKFTPRHLDSKWSVSNRKRIAKLIREGRMTPMGLAKVTYPHPERFEPPEKKPEPTLPRALKEQLKANAKAWKNFENMAPSYRRLCIRWITDAKKPETMARRMQEAIGRLERNEKLGL